MKTVQASYLEFFWLGLEKKGLVNIYFVNERISCKHHRTNTFTTEKYSKAQRAKRKTPKRAYHTNAKEKKQKVRAIKLGSSINLLNLNYNIARKSY